jgi:hypothetical protein
MGAGVGLRPPHYQRLLESRPSLEMLELVSENFMVAGGNPRRVLARAHEAYPLALHGVSMDLGGLDPLDASHLGKLRALCDEVDARFVSDHVSWGRFAGRAGYDLWPLPYTEEALEHLAARVAHAQERLGRRLLVENPSAYLGYTHETLDEPTFLGELVARTGCGLLVDVNNVYVSARNLGRDAAAWIDRIPVEAIGYVHLAGHTDKGAYLLDTHDHPVIDEVWTLYRRLVARAGALPTIIEWDDRIPDLTRLLEEAHRADREAARALEGRRGRAAVAA